MAADALIAFLRALDWDGAVLGAVVSGAFAGSAAMFKRLADRRPLRRFLGQLVDRKQSVSFFLRDMQSVDGKYYAWDPMPPQKVFFGFNVVAQPDVSAAADIINLLGKAGRSTGFEYPTIQAGLTKWSDPLICIGGSLKATQAIELCVPKLVSFEFNKAFVTSDGQRFESGGQHDFGLLYRGSHPQTGAECWVLQGFGVTGTVGAGAFLSRRALDLAALFGAGAFAVILRAKPMHGPESCEPVWIGGEIAWNRLLARPLTWWRYRKLLR